MELVTLQLSCHSVPGPELISLKIKQVYDFSRAILRFTMEENVDQFLKSVYIISYRK